MRRDWVTTSLGDVCAIQSGAGFPKDLQGVVKGEFPFYKVSDMNTPGNERFMSRSNNYISESIRKNLRAKVFPKGAIIFPKVGGAVLTNKKRQIATESCVDNNIMGLIPKDELIRSEFLRYFMESLDIYDWSNRANPPSIRQSTVEEWPILLPPLLEQERIVAILDEAFTGISAAVANTEKNLANARELFESYLNAAFSQHGEAWSFRPLESLTQENSDITYGVVKPGPEGEVLFVRGGDISGGTIKTTKLRTITQDISDQYRRTLLRGGEIVMCLVGVPGQTAVVPSNLAGANIARQVGLVRLRPEINPHFISLFLRSRVGLEGLGAFTGGSVQQVINLRDLKKVQVPLPDRVVQDTVVLQLGQVTEQAASLQEGFARKHDCLNELKHSLLQKAFSGELTKAPQAEIEKALA